MTTKQQGRHSQQLVWPLWVRNPESLPTKVNCVVVVLYYTVLYYTALYCTVLHCTVLYCTVLYCTVLYCTALHCTALYSTVLHCNVLYCTALYFTVLHCILLYCTLLHCTTLYSTVLYCTLVYSTVLYSTVLYSTVLYHTELYFCHRVAEVQLANLSMSITRDSLFEETISLGYQVHYPIRALHSYFHYYLKAVRPAVPGTTETHKISHHNQISSEPHSIFRPVRSIVKSIQIWNP
jgi:hypothetical protein